jgi:hypothetical protein
MNEVEIRNEIKVMLRGWMDELIDIHERADSADADRVVAHAALSRLIRANESDINAAMDSLMKVPESKRESAPYTEYTEIMLCKGIINSALLADPDAIMLEVAEELVDEYGRLLEFKVEMGTIKKRSLANSIVNAVKGGWPND